MLWTRTQGGEGEMGGTAVAQPGARCLMWASRYPLPTAGRCENAVSIPASPSPSLAFTGSLNLSADSAQQRLNVSFPTASPPCSYHTPLLCPPVRSPSSLNDRLDTLFPRSHALLSAPPSGTHAHLLSQPACSRVTGVTAYFHASPYLTFGPRSTMKFSFRVTRLATSVDIPQRL